MSRPSSFVLAALSLLSVVLVSGCGTVGKGPDPDPVPDLSRGGDMSVGPLCTAKTCAGCCMGDICEPGITSMACGSGGAMCAQCSDSQTCGASFQCAFDPNASWLVVSVTADLMLTNPLNMGKPWRADLTNPQPYVVYDMINSTGPVAIVVSGSPPVWTATWGLGFIYAAKDLLSTGFDLQVFDREGMGTPTPMSNKHHVTLNQQDFTTKTLIYQGWEGVNKLTLKLQRQ